MHILLLSRNIIKGNLVQRSGENMSFIEITQGSGPVVLGFPHTGPHVPENILRDLNDNGRLLADTDWHIHDLYSDLLTEVTTVRTLVHRYVIDANRDPAGASLYPGQNTTELCPTTDFDGKPIYREGAAPDAREIAARRAEFHAPYHAALQGELDRVRAIHGFVVLYDCHSIRSDIPFLFEGILPDFNIGTADGVTCDRRIEDLTVDICTQSKGISHVLNGRFKGGWTTRHYGQPDIGQHAIQMEIAQATYMHEAPPWTYDTDKAATLRAPLKTILTSLSNWRPT